MKRVALVLVCLALAVPAWAEKNRRVPRQPLSPLAPTTVTITGSPLTIVVGNDTSLQVTNSNVPGTGQFYPPDCTAGQTADSGVFAGIGTTIFGPDFNNHPCGSASNSYTPWTPVSLSPVSGTGTSSDPFTVVIVVNAGISGVQLTETITYVNGDAKATIVLSWTATPPPGIPLATPTVAVNAFVGSDLYLADNDRGFSFGAAGGAGGHGADTNCVELQYTITWLGTTPATAWTAQGYSSVWDEISAGNLDNTVDPTCIDNGASLEWAGLNVGTTPTVINTGVSFTGNVIPVPPTAAVPTLSVAGIAALVLLLAVVGYVLAKKTSLGA